MTSIFHGIGIFLFSFCSSMALGVSFGLGCSLILKHSSLHLYHGIESCLVALIAYTSYFFSNGMHMSGTCRQYSRISVVETNGPRRHRLSTILWNHTQTLRLPYNVQADPTDDKVYVRRLGSTVGEFHLHIPRSEPLHPRCSSLQALIHSCHNCQYTSIFSRTSLLTIGSSRSLWLPLVTQRFSRYRS